MSNMSMEALVKRTISSHYMNEIVLIKEQGEVIHKIKRLVS